jgi:hypothetical protein
MSDSDREKQPKSSWLKSQYNDLKGHAKWRLVETTIFRWGGPVILGMVFGFIDWIRHGSWWQVWGLTIGVTIIFYCVLPRCIARKAKAEHLKRALSPENSAVPQPQTQANQTPLSFTLERDEGKPKIDKWAGCHIRVRNESQRIAAENVEVRLMNITPIPKHTHPLSLDPRSSLPDAFPVFLKPESGECRSINPGSDAQFELFHQIRHSNVPTIQFLAKDKQFGLYSTSEREHTLEIEVSAHTCVPIRKRFKLTFARDLNGIPVFSFESV